MNLKSEQQKPIWTENGLKTNEEKLRTFETQERSHKVSPERVLEEMKEGGAQKVLDK